MHKWWFGCVKTGLIFTFLYTYLNVGVGVLQPLRFRHNSLLRVNKLTRYFYSYLLSFQIFCSVRFLVMLGSNPKPSHCNYAILNFRHSDWLLNKFQPIRMLKFSSA